MNPARAHTSDDFLSTRWSVVRDAGGADAEASRAALETLCGTYWYPLYAFVRRRGVDADEARDVTQGFFAQLLERRDLAGLDPERGRFRAFLLASIRHHLANVRDRERALKRGGGAVALPIDMSDADERYGLAAPEGLSPERLFERSWALATLDAALGRVRAEYAERGRDAVFEALKGTLTGEGTPEGLRAAGERIGLSEGAAKVAAHRLRERFRRALRDEVAGTLEDPSEVEDELAALFAALAG